VKIIIVLPLLHCPLQVTSRHMRQLSLNGNISQVVQDSYIVTWLRHC